MKILGGGNQFSFFCKQQSLKKKLEIQLFLFLVFFFSVIPEVIVLKMQNHHISYAGLNEKQILIWSKQESDFIKITARSTKENHLIQFNCWIDILKIDFLRSIITATQHFFSRLVRAPCVSIHLFLFGILCSIRWLSNLNFV